jgi:oligoribonuclease NrnB/cAMP/cGMP phosphodiesterase (DHH superfamily)
MSEFKLDLNQVEVVVYHQGCMDGLTAAAAFRRYDHIVRPEKPIMKFIPMRAGDLPEAVKKLYDTVIVFVDCSPPTVKEYEDLCHANAVFIIDHHKSAKDIFGPLDLDTHILIDVTHSAAYLAWNLFRNLRFSLSLDETRFIMLVEDYDIQANRLLPDSKYLAAALQIELNKIDETKEDKLVVLEDVMKNKVVEFIQKGKELQEEIDFYVHSIVEKGMLLHFPIGTTDYCGYFMKAESWNHSTDIGRAALELDNVTVSILEYPGKTSAGQDVTKMSLRSNKLDVSKLAKIINNGGGHKQAAGCDKPDGYSSLDFYAALVEYFKEEN